MQRTTLICMLIASLLACAHGCVHVYGTGPNQTQPVLGWTWSYSGRDWGGLCASGTQQTPVNLVTRRIVQNVPRSARSSMSLPPLASNGTNVHVLNTGGFIQVQWAQDWRAEFKVEVPASGTPGPLNTTVLSTSPEQRTTSVRVTPLQFHFHAHSEHFVNGVAYPLEMHMVTRAQGLPNCPEYGCYAVFGAVFELETENVRANPTLDAIFNAAPMETGATAMLPAGAVINFNDLYPRNRTYVTYSGSLTTPPCLEGILWHLYTTPMKITLAQLEAYERLTADTSCEVVNGTETCTKLGAGHTYRLPVALGQRLVRRSVV